MGRWVTSKGRRIYIPDEGEKVPEKYKKNVVKDFGKEDAKSKSDDWDDDDDDDDEDDDFEPEDFEDDDRELMIEEALKKNKLPQSVRKEIEQSGTKSERALLKKYDLKNQINKDEDKKEKQIAANKKKADEMNGKKSKMGISEIRDTPEGRKLIDSIEEAEEEIRGRGIDPKDTDEFWVRAKAQDVAALKKKFGYDWEKPIAANKKSADKKSGKKASKRVHVDKNVSDVLTAAGWVGEDKPMFIDKMTHGYRVSLGTKDEKLANNFAKRIKKKTGVSIEIRKRSGYGHKSGMYDMIIPFADKE